MSAGHLQIRKLEDIFIVREKNISVSQTTCSCFSPQSSCYTPPQAFSSKCYITAETAWKKSPYSPTDSLRERDHLSTVSAPFKVSSLQSLLHFQTVDSSSRFQAFALSVWSPFPSIVHVHVICYIKHRPTPDTHIHTQTQLDNMARFGTNCSPGGAEEKPSGVNTTGSVHRWETCDAPCARPTHLSDRLLI